jgi:predicted hydrolase (HD superfamily)
LRPLALRDIASSGRNVVYAGKDKRFAAGADREQIISCEQFNMKLEDFIEHTLVAMAEIEKELGF